MRRRATIRSTGSRPVPITWLDPVAASPIDLAVGGLLLIVLGLLGLVWGAAFFSSLIINGEAADLSVGDAAVALARLGRNRLGWGGVWSPEIEEALAGPRWFWLVFAVEALLLGLIFWPMWRLFGPRPADPMAVVIEEGSAKHPRKERREAERTARTERRARRAFVEATPAPVIAPDAAKLIIEGRPNGRLVLGRVGDRLLATEKRHSVLALGPTGSGKTSGLALPALLEWRGPALVVSAKADLAGLAWEERDRGRGTNWLFDPTSSMPSIRGASRRPPGGHGWSPLQLIDSVPRPRNELEVNRRIRQWSLARRTAHWMVDGVRPGQDGGPLPAPWYAAAEQILAPMLLAAAASEVSMGQVVEWVDRRDHAAVRDALANIGVAEAEAAWDGAHHYDEATTVGSYQILSSVLYPFGDPVVLAQATAPQISAAGLLDGKPNTLFVLAPANHQDRLRPLLTTIISEVIDAAMNEAASTESGHLEHPLLVIIDDAVGCAPFGLLDQLASLGAGLGIQVLTLSQDLSQLGRVSGQERASQLADSHRARVVLPGITDPFTLDYLNALIRGNRLTDPSRTDVEDDAVISGSAGWMRTLDDDAAIVIYGNLAPIRVKLRPWYGDKALVGRLQPEPAVEPSSWRDRFRRPSDDLAGGGFPNPFDSEANDREADRYWKSVRADGVLPEPLDYNDGSTR